MLFFEKSVSQRYVIERGIFINIASLNKDPFYSYKIYITIQHNKSPEFVNGLQKNL